MHILQEHKNILLNESQNKTLQEWVQFFDNQYTKSQIYSFCYHNHKAIKKLSQSEISVIQSQNVRKYNINKDYFKAWSRNMAYIFGFWCADGCIYNGRIFDITIHKKDKYILKKIAEELEYQGNLYDSVDRQVVRINFSCKEIYDDILNLGGCERKSNVSKFPNIPTEYLPDFIRGYFDGDGCIMNLKGDRINSAFTSGSKEFLDCLLEILKRDAGVLGGSYDPSSKSLRFGKKDSIKIGEYIYQNSPELFLERKRNKFII